MSRTSDDLVITGYGVVSPLGLDKVAFWEALAAGRCVVSTFPPHQPVMDRVWMGSVLEDFEAKDYVQPRKALKVMCLETQMAFAAAVMACRDAGIEPGKLDPDRLGTVFGSEILMSEYVDVQQIVELCRTGDQMNHGQWAKAAIESMYPLWMLKSLPNMPACHIGIWLDARGPNNTLTTEATSSLSALMEAGRIIQRGQADCMLVGASGNRTSVTRYLQRHEAMFSTSFECPEKACRPFDRDRNGTVMSMASAVVVLERRSHAESRGRKPLAQLVSWSSTFGRTSQKGSGSAAAVGRSIAEVIERGKITHRDLDHINSSANGSIAMDANEAVGIQQVANGTPVTSIKGAMGDAGCGSGLLELAASLCGIENQCVPRTINHDQTAVDCPVIVIAKENKPWNKPHFVKTSVTPYGQATAVLIKSEL